MEVHPLKKSICGSTEYDSALCDSPLSYAIRLGDEDIFDCLIELGFDVNQRGEDGYTSLHYAVSNGKLWAVARLLEHGADVNAINGGKETPLHLAFYGDRHKAIIDLLVEKGADINIRDDYGLTPFTM